MSEYFENEDGRWEIIDEYSRILVEPSQEYLKRMNAPKSTEEQKQEIIMELQQLDMIIPRYAEDLYIRTSIEPYDKYKETIDKKLELRLKLKELSEDVANSNN